MSGARQARVEQGLTPALRFVGRADERYSLVERMDRYRVPGVAIGIVDDGEIAWASGYGRREAGGGAVHASTLFQAASISKAVAAIGVLALVEHGAFGLDDPVDQHLRSWHLPPSAHTADRPVTIRALLSHTAGTTVPGFPGYPVGVGLPSVADVLAGRNGANTDPVESFAAPGTLTQYSGGGTTIVQQLVCDVTGRDFDDLMHALVLSPFGMVDSAYEQPLSPARQRHAASGHDGSGRPVTGGHHVYPELQAAGLWTNVLDLCRWVIGVQEILRGDRVGPISKEMAEQMITVVGDGPFGLGPELAVEGATRRFLHSGANEGFRTHVDGLIEVPVGAAVLTNAEGGTTLFGEIRRSIAAEYGWGDIGAPAIELADVDPALLASYAGRYAGPFDRPMRLEHADGELFSPAPYGRRRMFPLGPTTFLDEETGATLEVIVDGGSVERIAVMVDGSELMAFVPVGRGSGA